MKKYLILLFLTCFSPALLWAQSTDYYVQLNDGSGFNTTPYQDSLELHAQALNMAIPVAMRPLFRVYDFGFYLHQEVTEGYPSVFEKKKLEVAAITPYYLLFGKQTDKTGVYTKFWVEINLPDSSNFECLTSIQREVLTINMGNYTNGIYSKAPSDYAGVELAVMDSLRRKILEIVDCCYAKMGAQSCSQCLTPEEVLDYLKAEGFDNFGTCHIESQAQSAINPYGTFNVHVIDNTNLAISTADGIVPTLFKHLGEYFLNFAAEEGVNATAIITKNENFCDNTFSAMEDSLPAGKFIWWHIWDNPVAGESDYFFIKNNFNDPGLAKHKSETNLENYSTCNPAWPDCPCCAAPYQGISSGIFFVFGTNQDQTWANNYAYLDDSISGCKPTFQPNYIDNFDFLAEKLASNKHKSYYLNKCFDWSDSNGWFNDAYVRKIVAARFANFVINNLSPLEEDDQTIPITLFGYSHGGNVALQAIPLIYQATGKKINLITIATPAANTISPWSTRKFEDPNNDLFEGILLRHYHLWMKGDYTAGVMSKLYEGSDLYYRSSYHVTNKELISTCNPRSDKHGFPYFLQCIKENPFLNLQRQ